MIQRIVLGTLLIGALVACDDFPQVQQADTIEAYEGYLAENPDSVHQLKAESRLEELYLDKARADKTLAGYDEYLEKFPKGVQRDKALEERETFLWDDVRAKNTIADWQKYLDEYPRGKKKRRLEAKRMIKVLEYAPQLSQTEVVMKQINLAEDPKGPLNGWAFQTMVTNNGDKTLDRVDMKIEYLGPDGAALDAREWPLVAEYWQTPVEDWRTKPIKPGETRAWDWATGTLPENWSQKVKVYPTRISYAKKKIK